METKTRNILGAILFFIGAYCFYQLYFLQQKNTELQYDYAEATSVKYGLFNPETWKEKVTEALYKKIDKLDFSGANKQMIEEQINNALNMLVDQINNYIKEKENSGNIFSQLATRITVSLLYDETQIRAQIPEYTEKIMQYINSEDSKEKIKSFLKEQLNSFLDNNISKIKLQNIEILKKKYSVTEQEKLPIIINNEIKSNEKESQIWIYSIYGLAVVIFLLAYNSPNIPNMLMLGGMLLLWTPAILLPMMSVGAELENIKFNIIGTDFEFKDQTLFYQSKSVVNLVESLFKQGDFSSTVVGILVAFFSVIFPIIKIVLSFIYSQMKPTNNFVRYLVRYGSKWSMADVFVVAIFMSFIGFKSIISHQLHSLEEATNFTHIETADLTRLHFPVFFFVTFVVMNILATNKIIWHHQKTKI